MELQPNLPIAVLLLIGMALVRKGKPLPTTRPRPRCPA